MGDTVLSCAKGQKHFTSFAIVLPKNTVGVRFGSRCSYFQFDSWYIYANYRERMLWISIVFVMEANFDVAWKTFNGLNVCDTTKPILSSTEPKQKMKKHMKNYSVQFENVYPLTRNCHNSCLRSLTSNLTSNNT